MALRSVQPCEEEIIKCALCVYLSVCLSVCLSLSLFLCVCVSTQNSGTRRAIVSTCAGNVESGVRVAGWRRELGGDLKGVGARLDGQNG